MLKIQNKASSEQSKFEKRAIKTTYPRGKGPRQELHSSSRRTAVVPLFKNYMQFSLLFFSGLGNVASPSSNEHGSWWASNIQPFDWRRRRNHFTTASPLVRHYISTAHPYEINVTKIESCINIPAEAARVSTSRRYSNRLQLYWFFS